MPDSNWMGRALKRMLDLGVIKSGPVDRVYTQEEVEKELELGQGACKCCGTSREDCDARILAYPKRCCPACKESGPVINHA